MEFVNGGNLAFHLKNLGHFPEELIQFYSAQIVCCLTFLHENNILHL